MKVLQVLLSALLPLLERRVLAAERQAASAERLEDLVRTYLCWGNTDFRDLLAGALPAEELPVDVVGEHGTSRDLKLARMEAISAIFAEKFGSTPTDEQVVLMYEQMYETDQRGNADSTDAGAPS